MKKKNKISASDLLIRLDRGEYASEIARNTDVTRQAINNKIHNFRKRNLIELSKPSTKDTRSSTCSPAKIYKMTVSGHYYLQLLISNSCSQGSSGRGHFTKQKTPQKNRYYQLNEIFHIYSDENLEIKEAQVTLHNLQVAFPIINRGSIPGDAQFTQMTNWVKYTGTLYKISYEITTKHIFIWPRVKGKTIKECKAAAVKVIRNIYDLFKNTYGWKLKDCCEVNIDNCKWGIVNVADVKNMLPHTGKSAVLDRTPEENTIHPRDIKDVDSVVDGYNSFHRIKRDLEHLISLEQEIRDLNQGVRDLVNALKGRSYAANEKRVDEKRDVV